MLQVPTDLAFMALDKYPVGLRKQLLAAFLDVFRGSIKGTDRDAVVKAEAMLADLDNTNA